MDSHHDEENYTLFLSTLDKEQLIRLALIARRQSMELRMRYLRMRGAALYGTKDEAQNLSTTFEQDSVLVEIPEDINYNTFVSNTLWK